MSNIEIYEIKRKKYFKGDFQFFGYDELYKLPIGKNIFDD